MLLWFLKQHTHHPPHKQHNIHNSRRFVVKQNNFVDLCSLKNKHYEIVLVFDDQMIKITFSYNNSSIAIYIE